MSLPPDTGAVELVSFKQHISRLLAQNKRPDGRSFNEIRIPHILHDDQSTAKKDGVLASTLYTDDTGTCLSCNVSGMFGPPPPQKLDEGRLLVNVTAPFFPSYIANEIDGTLREIARFVRTTVFSCLDLTVLSVIPGEACWVLWVELVVMNADGGLRAAALHTTVAALCGLTLPKARLPNGDVVESRRLRFRSIPVMVTIGVYGVLDDVHFYFDTSAAEESVVEGLINVVFDESGGVIALMHQGRYPLVASRLVSTVEILAPLCATLRSAIVRSCGLLHA